MDKKQDKVGEGYKAKDEDIKKLEILLAKLNKDKKDD